MIEVAQKYIDAGFAVLPANKTKSPMNSTGWKNGFSADIFNGVEYIGLICGKISGGLECIDFDNHFKDAKQTINKFLQVAEVMELYSKYKFPIEKTMNGGYHLLFCCPYNEGNKKLAMRVNSEKTPPIPEALIETRGEGGYFVCSPSPGYEFQRNDVFKMPVISEVERAILFDAARSFNEFIPPPIKNSYESNERPGDLYNNKPESIDEAKEILKRAGWTELQKGNWRRPNKKEGVSATFGKVASNIFYVFSSSAYPFDSERAYTPFQILSLLKFNGDFSAAAESLPKPEKKTYEQKQQITETELQKILTNSFIDTKKSVPHPPTILSIIESDGATRLVEKRLFTLGNFSCIIGKAKSKKTFFINIVTSALLKNGLFQDHLKSSMIEEKKKILYFDTEQGEYDSYNCIKRIEQMAGTNDNMLAFNLRPFSPAERCQLIEYSFKTWGKDVGFCVIDGIADLANAINDEDEATRVVTMLLRLTKVYNCHISTIIHQNKNDNYATGHLGSAIMKKAEILISVTKDAEKKFKSLVSCDMSRSVDFSDFEFIIDFNGIPEITRTEIPPDTKNQWYNKTDTIDKKEEMLPF